MATIEAYETASGRRYRVRYRKPDHTQTSKRGFPNKRAAEDFLHSIEDSKNKGQYVDPNMSRITVGAWSEKWFEAQIQLKPTTLSGYRHGLDKHVLPRWGKVRLADVRHGDVQTWVNGLAKHLGPGSVRQMHLILSGVMKFAVRDGRILKNPSDDIRLPRITKKARGYLSHEQVARLAVECEPYADVIRFLAYTGLRWGEMAALRVGRLDMLKRRVDVAEAVSEPRGQLVFGTPKNHERRSVPFPAFLAEPLARRCEGKGREDLVFAGLDGGVLRGSNFRKRYFDKAVARLIEGDPEFPRVTPHGLRHTAASLAVSAGANVKAVQRMLGHASAAMTLDVYADLFEDDLDEVATALNEGASAIDVSKLRPQGAVAGVAHLI